MNHLKSLANGPVFFERNRVKRVYDGGKLFSDFFGDPPEDGKFPEEWIASTVRALNRDRSDPEEGLSKIDGADVTLKALIAAEPEAMLGARKDFGVLVKMLDSAIRLPMQAHPDRAFSEKHFHSSYGKTEMWLIVATRENACIHFGFKERLTKAEFDAAVEASLKDKEVMTTLVNRVPVSAGEVYLIPPKTVHAIGSGCLILEVQEPTDFTIQPEYWCGDYLLDAGEMYLGLSKEDALDCFDFDKFGPEVPLPAKKRPVPLVTRPGLASERLVGPSDTPCFSVNRHTLTGGTLRLEAAPAVLIVVEGEGTLSEVVDKGERSKVDKMCVRDAADESLGSVEGEPDSDLREIRAVSKGDYFFLPAAAAGRFALTSTQKLVLVECLPPRETKTGTR